METTKYWVEQMPKVELHCHLDGSLSATVIEGLTKLGHVELEKGWRKEICVDENCPSLKEYLKCFDVPLQCLRTAKAFTKAVEEVFGEAAKEQIMYMELRFAPMLSVTETLLAEEIVCAALEGLKKAKELYPIQGNLILCCMRHHGMKENEEVVRLAKKYQGKGVCAIDLAGDESSYPTKAFAPIFDIARQAKIPFTIHAGECNDAREVRTALAFGAQRIGHGIAMKEKEELQNICKREGIGVELCPTSNLQTKAVAGWKEYPIQEFIKRGLLVSVNTDNRIVSDTTLTDELWAIWKRFAISPETLTKNAIATSFATEEEKEQMRKRLQTYCR